MNRLRSLWSPDAHKASRLRLATKMVRGPIFDFKELLNSNGKVWPVTVSNEKIQRKFPPLRGLTNNIALVGVSYTTFSDDGVLAFLKHDPRIQTILVRPVTNPLKWLLWSWFMPKATDSSIVLRGDIEGASETLEMHNKLAGYVFLLDRTGTVRWKAAGMPCKAELDSLSMAIDKLLHA